MLKSNEFKIDLNAKANSGRTPFLNACLRDLVKIVEIMIDNQKLCLLDLIVKDNLGRNGFQIAKNYGARKVVKLIMEKYPSITEETTEQH